MKGIIRILENVSEEGRSPYEMVKRNLKMKKKNRTKRHNETEK